MFDFNKPRLIRNNFDNRFARIFQIWVSMTMLPKLKCHSVKSHSDSLRGRHVQVRYTSKPRSKIKWSTNYDFMFRLARRIDKEICRALKSNQPEEAIRHLRRHLARPFEGERNRLWRLAYLHEYLGENNKAIDVYEKAILKFLKDGEIHYANIFTRELVRLEPDNPGYRGQLAERYLDEDYLRHAVNELQIQKRLYYERGEVEEAEHIFKRIVILVDDLKSRNLLEKIVTPPDEFSFDFDNQIDIDLDGVDWERLI